MAERRMFAKTIIDSDAFLDMPLSTQSLYFHLSMRADDDGFINNPRKIQRMVGASEDDLKLLIAKNFIIPFESGIVVIKHWKIHNYIQSDRYKPTVYAEEKEMLELKKNRAYTIAEAECIQDVYSMEPQVRLGKVSLDKDSIEEEEPAPKKPTKHKYGEYKNVLLTDEELEKLQEEYSDYEERIERLSSYVASTGKSYKSHYATIRNWARKDAERPIQTRKEVVPKWVKGSKQNYDFEALERDLAEPVMVAGNKELEAEAQALKKILQESY